MEKYKEIKQLGDGAFGSVYKYQNIENGEIVAVKKMKQKFVTWDECMQLKELQALRKLSHINIVKLKEVVRVNQDLQFIFEYVEKNIYSFYEDLKKQGKQLQEPQIKSIAYQIANSLAYMHKTGFFHRDLKPENILISEKGIVKLIDFGLARQIRSRPPFTEYVSTRWYRAPELILRSPQYNSPVDIFAFGCILAELYMMKPMFQGNSELDQISKFCSILGTPVSWKAGQTLASQRGFNLPQYQPVPLKQVIPNASDEAINLIQECLKWDPLERPNPSKILQHPFFSDVNKYLPQEILDDSKQEQSQSGLAQNNQTTQKPPKQTPIQSQQIQQPIQSTIQQQPINSQYQFGVSTNTKAPQLDTSNKSVPYGSQYSGSYQPINSNTAPKKQHHSNNSQSEIPSQYLGTNIDQFEGSKYKNKSQSSLDHKMIDPIYQFLNEESKQAQNNNINAQTLKNSNNNSSQFDNFGAANDVLGNYMPTSFGNQRLNNRGINKSPTNSNSSGLRNLSGAQLSDQKFDIYNFGNLAQQSSAQQTSTSNQGYVPSLAQKQPYSNNTSENIYNFENVQLPQRIKKNNVL